jgi:hypothetical protein
MLEGDPTRQELIDLSIRRPDDNWLFPVAMHSVRSASESFKLVWLSSGLVVEKVELPGSVLVPYLAGCFQEDHQVEGLS